jgi:hypothetical protein
MSSNCPSVPNFACGLQSLIDFQFNMAKSGGPAWLRVRNFSDVQQDEAIQLGFDLTPDGGKGGVGTSDIRILPQPGIENLSMHSIGMSMGKLLFGARKFTISHTFVAQAVQALRLKQWRDVWEAPMIVGIVTENVLFSIDSVAHTDVAGTPIIWELLCNGNERK